MKKGIVALAVVLFIGLAPRAARAAFLYHPDDAEVTANSYETWQSVDEAQRPLSAAERATLQPNYLYHLLFTPNDPQYPLQWNFSAIQVSAAWDNDQVEPRYGGDPAVMVAVLDTGVAYENYLSYTTSSEIATRVWTNPNEVADGLDNDGNGLVDDLHGWDFVNNDAHPNDDHGHGTHIANTIAGQTNNSVGVAGIAWRSTILPLKVLDAAGNGTTTTITAAVNYAVQAGADVINLSLGGNNDDPALHEAIQSAISRGVLVIAAAGNDGATQLNYPARYSELLSVGATQANASRAAYSNTGTNLDLVAPGGVADPDPWQGIVQESCQTLRDCSTMALVSYTGTSQAAAHVAGAAALLLACGIPGGSVAATLTASATDLGTAGYDTSYGAGLLNIQTAMSQAGCGLPVPSTPGVISAMSSAATTRVIQSRDPAPYTRPVFSWTGQSGAVYQVVWGRQGAVGTTTTQTTSSLAPTLSQAGLYQLSVRAIDALGRVSDARTFLYRFRQPTLVLSRAAEPSTVSLYTNTGMFVRTFSAGTGNVPAAVTGTLTDRQSLRLLVSGQASGTAVRVLTTNGVRLAQWRPFGTSLEGGVASTGVRRTQQTTLVAVTGAGRGGTVRWMTMAGQRVRSVKVFANHDAGVTITSADLDSDGTDEVIVAKNRGSYLAAFSSTGRQLWRRQPFGSAWRGQWSLTALDRNNDGRDEIAVGGLRPDGTTRIILLDSTGTSVSRWILSPRQGSGHLDLAAADLNGNGTEELLTMTRQGRGIVDVWSPTGRYSTSLTLNRNVGQYRVSLLQ